MTLLVDSCPNYDGRKCAKCGRFMPDYCLDQEELERKARAYDEMMAKELPKALPEVKPPKVSHKSNPRKEALVEPSNPTD